MSRPTPQDIAATHFDAIIIGAGINGAGIARDAALRGLRVLLLDKGDICSGTSSWSSRLIHGGLRYLEYFEVGLVRESLRERERLLKLAPHLVKPLPMLIPIYERGRRGPMLIRTGMMLYDILSPDKSLPRHQMLKAAEALRRAPGLDPKGLRGAAIYYDAQAEFAERLVVENALSAREHGATVLTYARAERLIVENEAVCGVELTDMLSGKLYAARASFTLNVAGPWVDEILTGSKSSSGKLIGGTKGSHLIVEKFACAPEDALYVEASADGRPFFIIPWNGKILIGTTDLRYEGDLDRVEASVDEMAYLISETNRVLPAAKLARESILYTYAGVRPLPSAKDGAASGITRRHFIHDHAPDFKNFFSIVGGKLTTYRNLSEQAVDLIFKKLGQKFRRSTTAQSPLPGAQTDNFAAFSEKFLSSRDSSFNEAALERFLGIYGTRAVDVLKIAEEDAELKRIFDAETGAIGAEIVLAFRAELAETLSDCLLRRTMVGLNSTAGLEAVENAAQLARQFLGWTESRAEQETEAYREYVRRFHPAAMKHRV